MNSWGSLGGYLLFRQPSGSFTVLSPTHQAQAAVATDLQQAGPRQTSDEASYLLSRPAVSWRWVKAPMDHSHFSMNHGHVASTGPG